MNLTNKVKMFIGNVEILCAESATWGYWLDSALGDVEHDLPLVVGDKDPPWATLHGTTGRSDEVLDILSTSATAKNYVGTRFDASKELGSRPWSVCRPP